VNLRVLVPVRSLCEGKTRLAGLLDAQARGALIRRLAARVIGTASAAVGSDAVMVLSAEAQVHGLAHSLGVRSLTDEGGADLNRALQAARRDPACANADLLLILFGDLPALHIADVHGLLAAAGRAAHVVIAPDRHHTGTNALVLPRGVAWRFHFGAGSFAQHCRAAEQAGRLSQRYDAWGTAFDMDDPSDFLLWRERRAAPANPAFRYPIGDTWPQST
jgi:2-phospho-L-lactate/phosphoenolpyruvate guanylyltransferase